MAKGLEMSVLLGMADDAEEAGRGGGQRCQDDMHGIHCRGVGAGARPVGKVGGVLDVECGSGSAVPNHGCGHG